MSKDREDMNLTEPLLWSDDLMVHGDNGLRERFVLTDAQQFLLVQMQGHAVGLYNHMRTYPHFKPWYELNAYPDGERKQEE